MDNLVETLHDWRYIVRVYAVIINNNNELLLSDEIYNNTYMTKFPGGGLEFGEGTIDCLKREAIEEFGQEIEIIRHFYTTDFFQESQFHDRAQLITIYYLASFKESIRFKLAKKQFDFDDPMSGSISFRWRSISDLQKEEMTFPIDRHVADMVKREF
jgi:8-oxo-dGTP diphosphatase